MWTTFKAGEMQSVLKHHDWLMGEGGSVPACPTKTGVVVVGEKKAVTNGDHKDKAPSFSDALSLLYLYGHPQLSHSTATPPAC